MSGSFVQRGQDLVDRGEYLEAVKVCRLGLLASPTEVAGRLVLATALAALRRNDEVLAEMRVALELEPSSARAHVLKAQALLRKGDALQAREIADRARQLAPDDPSVAAIVDDANAALGGVGKPRRLTAGLVDDHLESHTKHYPAHMGAAVSFEAPLDPESGHVTKPHMPAGPDTEPSERVLDVGDRSGTIELDPELEGIELAPDEAPLVDPPPPDDDGAGIELDTEDVELMSESQVAGLPSFAGGARPPFDDDGDEPTAHFEPRAPIVRPAPRKPAPGPGVNKPFTRPLIGAPGHDGQEPTVAASPIARRLSESAAPVDVDASAPELDELFPDDESGLSNVQLLQSLQAPVSGAIDTPPTHNIPGQPGYDDLAHELEPSETGPRARSEDMKVIKQGLGLDSIAGADKRRPQVRGRDRTSVVAERGSRKPRVAPRKRRRSPLMLYGVVVVLVIAGAVFAGLKVRDARLERQVKRAMREAERLSADDTYRGYLRAADAYARILDARSDPATRGALARTEAAIAAEFGDRLERATELVGKLGDNGTSQAHAARVYLALANGDAAATAKYLTAFGQAHPDAALVPYLTGRGALLAGDPEAAIGHFKAALAKRPSPLAYVGLGIAHASAGQNAEALAALDSGLGIAEGHPAATIERARVLVRMGQLPAPGQPEGQLQAVIAEGRRPVGEQRIGVSRQQVGWAALAIAEVAFARGDRVGAKKAIAESVASRPLSDWRYSEALSSLYLESGELAAARAEAERAAKQWPERPGSYVRLAQAALLASDPQAAIDAVAKLPDINASPDALAVRGRARLLMNDIDAAAADLDAALAARPGSRAAQIARAEVDLRRGDPRGAVARLKPLYEAGAGADIGIVYASALRRSGERERARRVLEDALEGSKTGMAYLELARLDRDEGKFRDARKAYAKAIESDPQGVDARLEAALLALDVGDGAGAREALDRLADDAPEVSRVLVAAARVRTITGDPAGAGQLLEKAAALATTPKWIVARERGRILLRTQKAKEAVTVLEEAVTAEPDDGDARILLVDAYLTANDVAGAQAALTDILKRFASKPEANLALGRVHLFDDRTKDAMAAFKKARKSLVSANAPPRALSNVNYWIGRVHYYDGQSKLASEALTESIKLDPGNADSYFFLAQIDYDAERFKQAIEAFDRALIADPTGIPLAYFLKGESAFKLRRKKTAKAALEKYVELAPNGELVLEAKSMLKSL